MLRINKVNISQEKLNGGFDNIFNQCSIIDFRLQLLDYSAHDDEMRSLYPDQSGHFQAWVSSAENEFYRVLNEIGSGIMNREDVYDLAEHCIRHGGLFFNREDFAAVNYVQDRDIYLSPLAFHAILSTVIHLGAVTEDGTVDQYVIADRRDRAFRSLANFLSAHNIHLDINGQVSDGYPPVVIAVPAQLFIEFFELNAEDVSIKHIIERTGWADARIHNA